MPRSKIVLWAMCALMSTAVLLAQPPGPPPGGGPPPPGAPVPLQNLPPTGAPLPGLTPSELATFQEGLKRFTQVDSVAGTEPGATGNGLGPRYNLNSCAGCHANPAIGGSSPAVNPQVAAAIEYGAQNTLPAFIESNGPVRVARFVKGTDGTADGSVHDLFVITGRPDATTCAIAQPDFAAAMAQGNLIFRIPTPMFGAGLVEAIPDAAILDNQSANASLKNVLGIGGRANLADDGTVARFGWKAQIRSLELFSGEAYNVEMGVTNELFPSERERTPGCSLNPLPEDQTNFLANSPVTAMSDVLAFSEFLRWLAPPRPQPGSQSAARGAQTFAQIGCALCHTPVLTTGSTTSAALANQPVVLYSDLLIHHMGAGLADGIEQGIATGDDFRSAPLWGLSQRIYLLHDGRTTDLTQAILAHASSGSEASAIVAAFQALPNTAMQDVLNFLRSL
jgi:CxxC motif-containing protein (DUF1111 family)